MPAARPLPLLFLSVLLTASLFPLTGCGSPEEAPGPVAMDEKQHEVWEIALVEMRIDKNEEFANPERTPLPVDKLPAFEGLNYYFPRPDLRFRTRLTAESRADTVTLTKRKGDEVRYVRKGTVAFRHQEQVHRLAVFGPADTTGGDYLWLPFFDATSGQETYGGGRYLDVKVDADGLVEIDFNRAYNPLCDYNPDAFNCTLPPRGNTLPFAVEAGEKLFAGAH
jgi:uncharacterized protein (DUF1684 family)